MSNLTTKGIKTRTLILREARRVLIQRGYGGLVLREIADSCGIKLGNLQYYFPTVEKLILAVIDTERRQDLETVENASKKQHDPAMAVKTMIEELVSRWRGDAGTIYVTLNLLSRHNKPYLELYNSIYEDHYDALESLIAAAVPELTRAERVRRARLVSSLIDGAPYQTKVGSQSKFVAAVVQQACEIALAPRST